MKTVRTLIKEIEDRKNNTGHFNYKFDWHNSADRSRLEWKVDRELAKLDNIEKILSIK